jgi:tetratricopeptide (TPR) repeat protein
VSDEGRDRISRLSSYLPQSVLRHLETTDEGEDEPHVERSLAALMLIDVTGFTSITTSAVQRGTAGVEQLSRSFNDYLGQIIDMVVEHGGDIAKIVGDALIPVWMATDEDLATVTRRAAACGLAIATRLGEAEMEDDMRLSLKVGVCAGEIATAHVGGLDGRWLFLIAGEGVAQLSRLEPHLETGDVVATPEAWALISDRFVGQAVGSGHVRLRSTEQPLSLKPLPAADVSVAQMAAVGAYVPPILLLRSEAGQEDWLAERRRTTVTFLNVRGVGDATPDVVPLLHQLAQAAQRVMARYDGWLKEVTIDDKGTTLIGVFGVPPYTHEDDPARAVEAALALQSEIRALGLGAGAGVTTGPTFCGPVGNARRRDFAMFGDHVNLAARLMQTSGDDAVLCDALTRDEAHQRISLERLPAYVLKGMSRPIDVYRASAAGATVEPVSLVDRRSELDAAAAALEALRAASGGLVLLEGEPGIGKSRLIEEWLRLAAETEVGALVGAASDIDVSTPYNAWRAVFERVLGLTGVTDRRAREELLLDRLSGDERALRLAPLLNPVLSLDLADTKVTRQMSGVVRGDNTADLLLRLLREEARRRPLMVVLEDAQWLDSASWSMVLRARRELPEVLIVLAMRPVADVDGGHAAAVRAESITLRLSALSRDDAVTLAAQRTGAVRLDEPVAALVHERAEGNPLFIEQLTYAMRDAGRIVVDHGLLRAASTTGGLSGLVIPDTIQRVITTRLDQLPPSQAMTLKVASVIGQQFAVTILADIYPLPIDRESLLEDLERLTRLDLVAPAASAPTQSYEFRHKITQEVAYNLMPAAQAQQLHRALAEWYERTYATDLSPFYGFLAHHWNRAGLPVQAVSHLELAAEQALRTFANEEAIGFLHQALELAADNNLDIEPRRRARWQLQLGDAFVNLSRYGEGRSHLEQGLGLLKRAPPARNWQLALATVGEIVRQTRHRLGLARLGRLMGEAQRQELVAVCRAYERLAEASYYGGETLLPLYSSIRILNEAESSGSAPEIARGLAGTGALFGFVPLPRVAEGYVRRALAAVDGVDDLTTHEIVGIVAGFYHIGVGHWDEARQRLATVRRIARRLGDRRRLEDAIVNVAEIEYLTGDFASGSAMAKELTTLARARGDRRFEAEGLAVTAYCAWQRGESDTAVNALALLKELAGEAPGLHGELRLKYQGMLALMHLGANEDALAIAAADEAMQLTEGKRATYFATYLGYVGPATVYIDLWEKSQGTRDLSARATAALDRLARFSQVFPIGRPRHATLRGTRSWLLGRHEEALRTWRRGLRLATELAMPFEEGLAHLELGRHLDAHDDERAGHLGAAREIFARLEAREALRRVDNA